MGDRTPGRAQHEALASQSTLFEAVVDSDCRQDATPIRLTRQQEAAGGSRMQQRMTERLSSFTGFWYMRG